MLRMYSKTAMLNILKTCLSLKMSNVYISNDRILMSIPHYYSICRLKISFPNIEFEYFYKILKMCRK